MCFCPNYIVFKGIFICVHRFGSLFCKTMFFIILFALVFSILNADDLCSVAVYDAYLKDYPTKCGNKCDRYKE